ncbi:MAG: Tm-1-like ATP-binding domain-containing protein [Pikeienuella sp.]
MAEDLTILIIGTYDTKAEELSFLAGRIRDSGGAAMTMDVSVLGDPPFPVDLSKHDVAEAAGSSIAAAIAAGGENEAMQIMATGAARLTRRLHDQGAIAGMIALGGSMGTDLALDCAAALPIGVPKYVVSTISFSPLIPPERLTPDIQMILWAGGLYGLNPVCRASLAQAAGAVTGAARAVERSGAGRPLIGMTSLGSSCLSYMKRLKPALEARGYDLAVFHATGMGGMAFEKLAAEGAFAAVMDFALPELGNFLSGSAVNAGADRLRAAGRTGAPQIVAPGCLDLVDFPAWQTPPARFQGRPFHDHNRLLTSTALNAGERRETAREVARRLAEATGPTHLILPAGGVEEWDRPGGDAHEPEALAAFLDEMRGAIRPPVEMTEIKGHINDEEFAETALAIFDRWREEGRISG